MLVPKHTITFYLCLISIIFLFSCAAIMAPPGGPIDDIPPQLIEVNPPDGTVNFNGQSVELIFSEYLDESTIEKSISLLPSSKEKPNLIYKGKRVIVEFSDSLVRDQTYIIVINRNLCDEHNVKIAQGLQVALSTGNLIDKGSIEGRIFHTKEASLQLWKMREGMDSLEFFNRVPDYIIDADNAGFYEFKFLSPGEYKILGVDQSMSGLPFNPEKILYGLTWLPIIELHSSEKKTNIDLKIPESLGPIRINSAEFFNENWGTIKFSGDVSKIKDSLSIYFYDDSSSNLKAEVFSDVLSSDKINFYFDSLKNDRITINVTQAFDGKMLVVDSGRVRINTGKDDDTTHISILKPVANYVHYIESDKIIPLQIVFSSLIALKNDFPAFTISKDSSIIPIKYELDSPQSVNIIPDNNWEQNGKYELRINRSGIGPIFARALKDTVVSIKFSTKDFQGFGSLVLNINDEISKPLTAELRTIKKNPTSFGTFVSLGRNVDIKRIPEGNYLLMLFEDINQDEKYTPGQLQPYRPSEPFYHYPDTIKIRANWDIHIDNISMDISR